jgi:hypothetical protein
MSEEYKTVLSVYKCELNRTRQPKRAFNALSKEAKQILIDNGFDIRSISVVSRPLNKTQYFKEVMRLTERVAHLIPGIEKRGFFDHHIDHIVSIKYGYVNDIAPETIADIKNLRMLPHKENMKKGAKVDDRYKLIINTK